MNAEAARWELAGINRAARAVAARQAGKSDLGRKPGLPRSDANMALAAQGKGMTWEESGRTFRAQAWCAGPYKGSYWYLIWAPVAYFPGEMRLVMTSDDGRAWLHEQWSYNAQGKRAHRHDGSSCFGSMSYAHGGCPGCAAEREVLAA